MPSTTNRLKCAKVGLAITVQDASLLKKCFQLLNVEHVEIWYVLAVVKDRMDLHHAII